MIYIPRILGSRVDSLRTVTKTQTKLITGILKLCKAIILKRITTFKLNGTNYCSYPSCSGARAPGLAADMHFRDNVIAFIGPACAFALEPVARLAAYWNTPIITGMGDQVHGEKFFI